MCCGRRSIATNDDQDNSNSGMRRSSSFENLRASFLAGDGPEEGDWKVGGRYKVQLSAPIFTTADLVEQSGTLRPKDSVLLLALETKACTEVGLVVPQGIRREQGLKPGWIVLQGMNSEKSSLFRKRMEGSWEMKARYRVNNPATVRQDANLFSDELGEVEPGQEVVVLDMSLDKGTDDGEARLRAMISVVDTSLIGWISPETTAGDRLLDPVNLLGMEVVTMHRKSLSGATGSTPPRASVRGSVRGSIRGSINGALTPANTEVLDAPEPAGMGGPRRSCIPGTTVPWEVGGKYRVLEKLAVREKPELTSRELGKVSPGALATITDIHNAECAHLGWCPCAFITIEEGPEEGTKGWVRCAAKDGHDLIDTRDQLESEKILQRLRASQVVGQRPQQLEPGTTAGADENTSDTTSDSGHSGTSSPSEVGPLKRQPKDGRVDEETDASGEVKRDGKSGAASKAKAEKVESFFEQLESKDTAREDRPIGVDGNTMEGPEKSICSCSCGTGGFRRKH